MPRGIPAKTKAERIKRLKLLKWSDQRIQETVGCSTSYLKIVLNDLKHEIANGHHKKAG
jgi:hypothetical protein